MLSIYKKGKIEIKFFFILPLHWWSAAARERGKGFQNFFSFSLEIDWVSS
jgi:hypothetical protein